MPHLKTEIGDIVGTFTDDWLSRNICKATGKGPIGHVGVVTGFLFADPYYAYGTPVVTEALTHVVETPLPAVIARSTHVVIIKPPLTPLQRGLIPAKAAKFVGSGYNYGDLILWGLNYVFHTRFFTEYFADDRFSIICSWLAAELEPTDFKKPSLKPDDVSPNDFYFKAQHDSWPMEWLS